jgi:hypothetical protein
VPSTRVAVFRDGHAIVFGIAPKTLRTHVGDELDGQLEASAKVRATSTGLPLWWGRG